MKDLTIPKWEVRYLLKVARKAHTEAVTWKRKVRYYLEKGDLTSSRFCEGQEDRDRNYARGIMLVLTAAREHRTPGERRAEREQAKRIVRETVVAACPDAREAA